MAGDKGGRVRLRIVSPPRTVDDGGGVVVGEVLVVRTGKVGVYKPERELAPAHRRLVQMRELPLGW